MGAPKRNTERRERLDREVASDPDIRGTTKGRRDQHSDQRLANGNDPERVEHLFNQKGGRG